MVGDNTPHPQMQQAGGFCWIIHGPGQDLSAEQPPLEEGTEQIYLVESGFQVRSGNYDSGLTPTQK